jgi:ADP-ribosyl-[dinitrogen reductase] hydrolase
MSHLPISTIALEDGGRIGITHCPGLYDAANPARDLAADLDAIRAWGAVAVLTLAEEHELHRLHVAHLGRAVAAAGMEWLHLPIRDMMAPDETFEAAWSEAGPRLHRWLDEGRGIHLHCRGGRGRAGMIAALLLVERGMSPAEAIETVREHRPGAIETAEQENYLLARAAAESG